MSNADGRLAGHVALVTGASRGLGAAIARILSAAGADVVLTDVRDDEGERLAEALAADGRGAIYRHLDACDADGWQSTVTSTEEAFGKLDVLVNNAGGSFAAPGIAEMTLADWERMTALNHTTTFLGIKHAVPAMLRAGGGAIVNVSSICGLVAVPGVPAPYTAGKGAVRLLTKSAAIELAADGIRVNSVHPGRIETPATDSEEGRRQTARMNEQTPLGRPGTPEDVAYGVLYLASAEAAYVTGAELVIDGGYTAR